MRITRTRHVWDTVIHLSVALVPFLDFTKYVVIQIQHNKQNIYIVSKYTVI